MYFSDFDSLWLHSLCLGLDLHSVLVLLQQNHNWSLCIILVFLTSPMCNSWSLSSKPLTLPVLCREVPAHTRAMVLPRPSHARFRGSHLPVQCCLEPSILAGVSHLTCVCWLLSPLHLWSFILLLWFSPGLLSHSFSTMIQWRHHLLNPKLAWLISGRARIYSEVTLECSYCMFAFPKRPEALQGQKLLESLFVL